LGVGELDPSDPKELVARLFAHPFSGGGVAPLAGLNFGAATSFGRARGDLPSYKTTGRASMFSWTSGTDPAFQDGARRRVAAQASWYFGRADATFEWVASTVEVSRSASHGAFTQTAWAATASFFLTDDAARYDRVLPRRPI